MSRRFRERNPDGNRKYYQENRKRILAKDKAKREADPKAARQKSHLNNERNAANWREFKREWRQKHREKVGAQTREWHAAHPERIRELRRKSENKRRARKLKLPYEDVDPAFVFERDSGICGICHLPVEANDWHLDHIIPLAAGGSHIYENVQVSHPRCNLRKGARPAV